MRIVKYLPLLAALVVLALVGCGDPEAAARAQYNEGMSLQRDGRVDEAIVVYQRLVERYPRTEIAVEVNKKLLALGAIDALTSEIRADTTRNQIEKIKSDIRTLEAALNLYRLDNFVYPTANQGLQALVERPRTGPEPRNWRQGGYMDRLPMDPWGKSYQYYWDPETRGDIQIFTVTPDGKEIGNWNLDQF